MQRSAKSKYLFLLLATLMFKHPVAAVEPTGNIEIALRYLNAMYATDYEDYANLLHPNATFDDPTAVAFDGEAWHITGRQAIVDFIRDSSEVVVDAGFNVQSQFSTGEFVVFNLEYRSTFEGDALGIPGKLISINMPAVTILQIQNGLVVHHIDHINYELMHEQLARQKE